MVYKGQIDIENAEVVSVEDGKGNVLKLVAIHYLVFVKSLLEGKRSSLNNYR